MTDKPDFKAVARELSSCLPSDVRAVEPVLATALQSAYEAGGKAGMSIGVRNAFDYVVSTTCNNYSGNPVVQSEKNIENRAMNSVAEDFLEELAPEVYREWKSILEAHQEGYREGHEAGVAAERERCAGIAKALGNLLNCVDGIHEPEWLDRCKREALDALAIRSQKP